MPGKPGKGLRCEMNEGFMGRIEREKSFHDEEFERHERERLFPLYRIAAPSIEAFIAECVRRAHGKHVLELGCGPGSVSLRLAGVAMHLTAVDISETGIRQARGRAARAGIQNAEFHVMDAETLDFPASLFEFACGRAILHHLDLRRALASLARVLAAGAVAMFLEPLGHNPALNWYRSRTPQLRTADEHPLVRDDLRLARMFFERVEMRPAVLLSLAASPLPSGALFQAARGVLGAADRLLLSLPGIRWWAWTSVWRFEDPKRSGGAGLHPFQMRRTRKPGT